MKLYQTRFLDVGVYFRGGSDPYETSVIDIEYQSSTPGPWDRYGDQTRYDIELDKNKKGRSSMTSSVEDYLKWEFGLATEFEKSDKEIELLAELLRQVFEEIRGVLTAKAQDVGIRTILSHVALGMDMEAIQKPIKSLTAQDVFEYSFCNFRPEIVNHD